MSIDHLSDSDSATSDQSNQISENTHFEFPTFDNLKKNEKNRNPSSKKSLLIIGSIAAGSAVVIGSILGVSSQHNNSDKLPNPNQGKKPVAASPSQPTQETQAPTSPEVNNANPDILKQKYTIDQMDAMDLNTFLHLSIVDRAAYNIAKGDPSVLQTATPENDLASSDPSAITDFYLTNNILEAFAHSNTVEGEKMGSSIFYTTESNGSIDTRDRDLADKILNLPSNSNYTSVFKYIDSGEWQVGTDSAGNHFDFINVTYQNVESTTGAIGETDTAQVVKSEIETLDNKDYIIYSIRLDTAGHTSPDPSYSY